MRHQKKGYARRVKQGWRSPVEIRGYHGKGFKQVIVFNTVDLAKVQKDEGIVIASTVGTRKRLEILAKAQEQKITILNIKPEQVTAKITAAKEAKQTEKKTKEEKKKKNIEESVKKAEKKEKDKAKAQETSAAETTEPADEEEKRKLEKKEKDDILIHKQ